VVQDFLEVPSIVSMTSELILSISQLLQATISSKSPSPYTQLELTNFGNHGGRHG
jgi:hypothetical protein